MFYNNTASLSYSDSERRTNNNGRLAFDQKLVKTNTEPKNGYVHKKFEQRYWLKGQEFVSPTVGKSGSMVGKILDL